MAWNDFKFNLLRFWNNQYAISNTSLFTENLTELITEDELMKDLGVILANKLHNDNVWNS